MTDNQNYTTKTNISFNELFDTELGPLVQDFLVIRKEFRRRLTNKAGLALFGIIALTVLLYMKWGSNPSVLGLMFTVCSFIFIVVLVATSLLSTQWEESSFKVFAFIGYFLLGFVVFWLSSMLAGIGEGTISSILMSFVIAIPAGLIPYAFYHDKQKQLYKKMYREIIVKRLVEGTDPKAFYTPEADFVDEFMDSDVFGLTKFLAGKYRGDDLVETTYGITPFRFFNLQTKTIRKNKDMFKGVFLVGDLKRKFQGSTTITPNVLGRGKISNMLAKAMGGTKSFIETDHPEFEKYFKAYSDNYHEVDDILNYDFMESILEFRDKISPDYTGTTVVTSMYTLKINVKYQRIYMAFDFSKGKRMISKKQLFELPKLVRSTDFRQLLQQSHEQLTIITEMMRDINSGNVEWAKSRYKRRT